jgi:diguanylate cyclase (GGDEF)-like protein
VRILIAEDDRIVQRLLTLHLSKLGHEVQTVSDGQAALRSLTRAPPQIAIIDWMMPGLEGPEVCRTLRGMASERYVYVILLTAKDTSGEMVIGLDAGADDYMSKPIKLAELEARLRSGQRIVALQEQPILARERMRVRATRDALTGLLNRGEIFELMPLEMLKAREEGAPFAALICDIDHFKRLNDTYGHPAGDAALREVAQRLGAAVRFTDRVGRYGGEEFLLALPGRSSAQVAEVAERIRRAVCDTPVQLGPAAVRVTISIGAALSYPTDTFSFEELLQRADQCLLLAKSAGRNRVILHAQPEAATEEFVASPLASDLPRPAEPPLPPPRSGLAS